MVALFVLATFGLAYSFCPGKHHMGQELAQYKEMVKMLKLTPEQQTKVKEIIITSRKNTINLHKDLSLKELELEAALLEESPAEEAVNKLIMESSEIRGKIQVQRVDERLSIKKILTPEQKTQLDNYYQHLERMRENCQMMRGQGMQLMPGGKMMDTHQMQCPMMQKASKMNTPAKQSK